MSTQDEEPATAPPPAGPEVGAPIACPACGAIHARAVRFCEECGAPIAGRTPRADTVRKTRPRAAASAPARRRDGEDDGPSLDREGRRLAHAALLKARQRLKFVRVVLGLHAFFNTVYAIASFVVGQTVLGSVLLAIGATALTGALTLHRFPFGWTVGCAAFQTLIVVLVVASGGLPILDGLFALLLWCAVPVMARAARILREHDDVYDAAHLRNKRSTSAPKAEVRARAEEQRRIDRRAGLRTMGIVAALLVAVGVGGTYAVKAVSKPRERAPRLEAFRAALAVGDAAAGEALCTDDFRGGSWRKVTTILEREDWLPGGVAAGTPEVLREGKNFAEVRFPLPRGHMRTMWRLVERDWYLDQVVFKGVRED